MENKECKQDIITDKLVDVLKYECKRYKSKGYGIIFAMITAVCFVNFLPTILKALWIKDDKEFEENQGMYYFIALFTVHELTVILTNLEFLFCYKLKHPFFERYKTTPDAWPWKSDPVKWNNTLKKTFKHLFLNHFILLPIFIIPDIVTNNCPYRFDKESFPKLAEILIQIPMCMLVEDFLFYLSHRLLHTNYFYSKVHKQHHEYVESVAISATYAHPVEYVLGNILPSSIMPMILGKRMHLLTYLIYLIVVLHESHDGHSGYNFSWSPHRLLPMAFDAEFHIFHHWKFKGNYANYFSIWDRVLGTINKSYLEYFNDKEKYIKNYYAKNN